MGDAAQLELPRVRQVVVAARDLDAVAGALRSQLGLSDPYHDPAVEYFGLRNAVFALGDTFLEVVSPVRDDAPAARLLDRRGGDCGYMVMLQVEDLAGARERARQARVREVFQVAVEDMQEVHLHPADMHGAIVSLSEPRPPSGWRWGGPGWESRSTPAHVVGAKVAVKDPDSVGGLWSEIAGPLAQVSFVEDDEERGLVEVALADGDGDAGGLRRAFEAAGVRFVFVDEEAQ